MKWVEIINLRSSGNVHREFADQLLAGIVESDYSNATLSHLLEIKTYYQPMLETDLSIHIYWESETGNSHKSPLALRIYSALMSMGLLNYSVWIETSSREFSQPGI
jgi:hypothetical protein